LTVDSQHIAAVENFHSVTGKFTNSRRIQKNLYKQIVKLREVIHLFATRIMIADEDKEPISRVELIGRVPQCSMPPNEQMSEGGTFNDKRNAERKSGIPAVG
jgi:hypothetical protein